MLSMMGKGKVAMAMSGGVDSSVAAAWLVTQGYEVIGITMRLSDDTRETARGASCGALGAAEEAKRIADIIGIAHEVVDFREIFRRQVIDYFLAAYGAGETPNPCIVCNRRLKFDALWQQAQALGADFIATGHYARITWNEAAGRHQLRKGRDEKKDQSYVLCQLPAALLPHVLLPLGDFTKQEVREMAREFALPVAQKAESQEICFIPDDDYGRFLRENRPDCLRPGDIVDRAGRVLGRHGGVPLYTIGQRRGLGIAAPAPLYVIGLDMAQNRVIVGESAEVFAAGLTAREVNWLTDEGLLAPRRLEVKVRYGPRSAWAAVLPLGEDRCQVRFEAPQRAITPGQSVVFYDGDEVLGGGVIDRSVK